MLGCDERPVCGVKRWPVNVGIWLYPNAPVKDLVDAVVAADRAGVDEIWIADEGVAREPIVIFSAAAPLTTRIRMGVGITSPALRHPGAIASSIATLDELNGGRTMLGFGVGGHESLGPFGITVEKPVALVRDAIRMSRAVLQRTKIDGYEPPNHAAPARDVPIYVGAKGEQLNRLASREADGTFLSGFELDQLSTPVAWARSVRPITVAVYASVRFRRDAKADPTALSGTPSEVAAGMAALAEKHEPACIGLALVDGDSIPAMLTKALETIERYRSL
jgi:alkanesulfonate monooxygenase SsuD/methylene tetrahydromethanopterin reductase-like flavin-dependent oxidoreductase (luciferase family)